MSEKNKFNRSTGPKKDEHYRWKATEAMKKDTYNEELQEEMEEVISAVVLSETYPPEEYFKNKAGERNEKE